MNRLSTFLIALLLAAGLRASAAITPVDRVVQIRVTYQKHDTFMPWQTLTPRTRIGYGIVIGPSRILTTESLVRNHRLIQLQQARSGEQITATVDLMDAQVDLAILKTPDNSPVSGFETFRLAKRVPEKATVEILQFDETTEVRQGSAEVFRSSVAKLPFAPYSTLTRTLISDVDVNGVGAAVTHKGRLAGLVVSYVEGKRTCRMLPHSVLKQFLDDAAETPYRGFASAGFRWNTLVDPVKRRHLNVQQEGKGILVLSCLPGTGAFETLKSNDVILRWDGQDIDNLGFYRDQDFGRLIFSYLIKGRRKPGDTVPVLVVRDRKRTELEVKLSNWSNRSAFIPENETSDQAEYLVSGGLIIRELSGDYLRGRGSNWEKTVDPRLVHLYWTRKHTTDKQDRHVVLLSSVLPDPVNIGYQHFRDEIVTHLNGKKIGSMADVFRLVDKDKQITRITLQSVGIDLALDPKDLSVANERIREGYRIPKLRHQRPSENRCAGPLK